MPTMTRERSTDKSSSKPRTLADVPAYNEAVAKRGELHTRRREIQETLEPYAELSKDDLARRRLDGEAVPDLAALNREHDDLGRQIKIQDERVTLAAREAEREVRRTLTPEHKRHVAAIATALEQFIAAVKADQAFRDELEHGDIRPFGYPWANSVVHFANASPALIVDQGEKWLVEYRQTGFVHHD